MIAAAVAVVVGGAHIATAVGIAITAAAEQDEQDDDPAVVATKETVITHNKYLREFFAAEPLIPWYSVAAKMCSGEN